MFFGVRRTLTLIDLLESVQKNFTRKIVSPTLPNGSDYWDRLQHFKLYSMQRRRERYSIFYVWKVIHELYPNPGLDYNNTTEDHRAFPNQGVQIDANQRLGFTAHHDNIESGWLKGKSVLSRCCSLYNCLPPQLRQPIQADKEPDFKEFKKAVDKWLANIPDQPTCLGRKRLGASNSIIDQLPYRQ